MVLGLALCGTFAYAQTCDFNKTVGKAKLQAPTTPNIIERPVDYKASIFAKAGDTLVTWEFDQAMASSVNAGTIGQNDRIDDTLVGNSAHGQNATYAIWQRIPDSAYIFSDNFANTYSDMATYTGQNFGAGRLDRIRLGVKQGSLLAIGYACLAALLLVCFGPTLMHCFVGPGQEHVVALGWRFMTIQAGMYWILALLFILRNTLQGIGQSFVPTMAGLSELAMRFFAAAQHTDVAALQGERGGVGGDVRTALIDDRHHAQRDGYTFDDQSAGTLMVL